MLHIPPGLLDYFLSTSPMHQAITEFSTGKRIHPSCYHYLDEI